MSVLVSRYIDLAALQHNFLQVKKLAPHSRVLAMVKANAYGHGVVRIASALLQADGFAVARLSKARELREAGIKQRIVLTQGFLDRADLLEANLLNCDIVLHDHHQLNLLKTTPLTSPIGVWIKIDTGMHRLGFDGKDLEAVYEAVKKLSYVEKPLHIMMHFSHANIAAHAITEKQIQFFKKTIANYEAEFSLAKSAAIMTHPESHSDWVRPGIMLYGVSPFANQTGMDLGLKPVMTVRAKIIAIRQQYKNDVLGYDGTYTCSEDMPVGVVAIGYADGYPATAQSGTPILVHGQRCQLVGRVNMDMLLVDLRQAAQAKIGDEVTLFGEGLPVEEVARFANTSPYEVITRQSQRESSVAEIHIKPAVVQQELFVQD